jgi:DNA-binding transcriptional LysR family regulator
MPTIPPKHAVERTSPRLKLRDLRILMTVVECGTMGKAAEQLAVSQPVVSKTISDMEHAMGVRLLDRGQHGVVPTAYGRALIKRGIVIFDEMRQGLREIEFLSDPTSGEVSVGATAPVAAAIVAPAVDHLCRQYPRMRFKAVVADSTPLFADLEARGVDFVIGRIPQRVPDHYNTEVLFHDEVKVVTGSKNPLAQRRSIALVDLIDEPWILSALDSYFRSLQAAVFRASGLEPPSPAVTATEYHLRLELLANNRLLTIVPGFSIVLPRPRPGVVALSVKLRVARDPVGIVTLKNRSLSPAAQLFIERVRDGTRSLANKA